MDSYEFTQDWFHWAPELWTQLLPHLPARRDFLEIGSFEGRSAVWMLENMIEDGGMLECIDTWEGGEEHANGEMLNAEERFDHNTGLAMAKFADETGVKRCVVKEKTTSVQALASRLRWAPSDRDRYDFVYIDGSHVGKDVLTDACMVWPLVKPGGILVFDDYMWGSPRDALHRPKLAIDAFVNIFGEGLDIVNIGYQCAIRKRA